MVVDRGCSSSYFVHNALDRAIFIMGQYDVLSERAEKIKTHRLNIGLLSESSYMSDKSWFNMQYRLPISANDNSELGACSKNIG